MRSMYNLNKKKEEIMNPYLIKSVLSLALVVTEIIIKNSKKMK